jgi:hypothetical protein
LANKRFAISGIVAKETREGDVYFRLLEKLQVVSEALQGQVFNVLGEVFEGNSLRTCCWRPFATATNRSAPVSVGRLITLWTAST